MGDGGVGLQLVEVVIAFGERIFSLVLAVILAHHGGAMGGQKLGDAVKIDPDLGWTVLGILVEDQLHPQVEVGRVDVVGVFLQAVTGLPGVSDDVSGGNGGSHVQI